MSLGLRLALLVLLAAVPIFLIQVFYELEVRDSRRERVLANAQSLAQQIAARQNRFVEAARFLVTAISRLEEVRSGDGAGCSRELGQIRPKFPEITGIGVAAANGMAFCSSTGRGTGIDLSDRPYFRAALRTRRMQTSGYLVGRATGSGSFVFAYPALNDDNSVNVVVILAYSTEILSQDLNDPPLPDGAFAALLDRNGVVVARWPDAQTWMGRNLSEVDWAKAALKQRLGVMRTTLVGGEFALAYAPMQGPTALTAIFGQPISPELGKLDAQFWREMSFMIVIFLLAATGAWVGALFGVQRPIRALTDYVDHLSQGHFGRLSSSGSVRGIPELRSLANHFRTMADNLAARETELKEAVQQKDMLLKEVNHRVKNSLQIVASLFALQRARISDPQLRRHFEDAGRRVSTVAQVHQRLYQDQQVDSVPFDEFLIEICEELGRALGTEDGARLECRASECRLSTDEAIPLALIVNELVTNAFKYGYPDGRRGLIRVECRMHPHELTLSVADDGESLPPDFDPAKSDGVGMRVVWALTRQLRGKLEVMREPVGKTFIVRIPR